LRLCRPRLSPNKKNAGRVATEERCSIKIFPDTD
jgi:hypothetical protein